MIETLAAVGWVVAVVGVAAAGVLWSRRGEAERRAGDAEAALAGVREEASGLRAELAGAARERDVVRDQAERAAGELARVRSEAAALGAEAAALRAEGESEASRSAERLAHARQEQEQAIESLRTEQRLRQEKQLEVHAERQRALQEANERLMKQLAQVQADMQAAFAHTAQQALKASSEQFLRLAQERMGAATQQAAAEMDKRRAAVEQLLAPIAETLKRTDEKLGLIERERAAQFGGLSAEIRNMQEANRAMREETARLVTALKKPEVRGRYGELQLRRVAELAGMTAYCDFCEQTSQRDDEGRLRRPDMLIMLPNERLIAVDAKTNMLGYIEACEARTDGEREACLERFAKHVADQVGALGKKTYWAELERSPDFTVMFVPGDQFLDAALARRRDLLERAAEQGVILASPSTLIGLLRAVAVGWKESRVQDQAKELMELGAQLHERTAIVAGHLDRMGEALGAAVERFNDTVGSFQSRFVPTLRKFEAAGAKSAKELVDLEPVLVRPRGELTAP